MNPEGILEYSDPGFEVFTLTPTFIMNQSALILATFFLDYAVVRSYSRP